MVPVRYERIGTAMASIDAIIFIKMTKTVYIPQPSRVAMKVIRVAKQREKIKILICDYDKNSVQDGYEAQQGDNIEITTLLSWHSSSKSIPSELPALGKQSCFSS